jgi:hypothetical protein
MSFLLDNGPAILGAEFEHGNQVVRHELGRYCSANKCRKPFFAHKHVLSCLNDREAIFAAFGLNWNDELPSASIERYINLIDLDLTVAFYCRS